MDNLSAVIGILAALSCIALGWIARTRTVRQDIKLDAASEATIKQGINYIKKDVEEIKKDLRCQAEDIGDLAERVTRVEESAKQAHKRIDELKPVAAKQ